MKSIQIEATPRLQSRSKTQKSRKGLQEKTTSKDAKKASGLDFWYVAPFCG